MNNDELTDLIEETLEAHEWFDCNGENLELVAKEIVAAIRRKLLKEQCGSDPNQSAHQS